MVSLRIGKNLNQRVREEKEVKRQGGWGVSDGSHLGMEEKKKRAIWNTPCSSVQ